MEAAVAYRPSRERPLRRSKSVAMGIIVLQDALAMNRDLYRQAAYASDFETAADRAAILRTLDRERVELKNALAVLAEEMAA